MNTFVITIRINPFDIKDIRLNADRFEIAQDGTAVFFTEKEAIAAISEFMTISKAPAEQEQITNEKAD